MANAVITPQVAESFSNTNGNSSIVERRSRISFECHTDLLMGKFTEELSGPIIN